MITITLYGYLNSCLEVHKITEPIKLKCVKNGGKPYLKCKKFNITFKKINNKKNFLKN